MTTKNKRNADKKTAPKRELTELETVLLAALRAASEHLSYSGYGDKWERECAEASGLEKQIAGAIAKADGET